MCAYIEQMKNALTAVETLDKEQEHGTAAIILDAALPLGDYLGESEEVLLEIAALAQRCARERDRQERRAAALNSYLYCG